MWDKISSFIKDYPEHYIAQLISRVFWPPPTVAVLAYTDDDEIVALELGGSYRLPGGFMDKSESLKEAAEREMREETGLDVEIGNLLDIRQNESGGPEIFFEAEVVGGEMESSWEGRPKRLPIEDIDDKVWALEHSHVHEYLFPDKD